MLMGEGGRRRKDRQLSEQVGACPLDKPVLATLTRQFARYLKQECQGNLSRRETYAVGEVIARVMGQVTIRMI